MKNTFNKYLLVVSAASIVIAIIALAYLLFSEKTKVANQAQLPTYLEVIESPVPISKTSLTDSTTGWKTYSNPQHKIEFKYPSLWTLEENSVFSSKSNKKLTIRYVSKKQNSIPTPTYCTINPKDTRCEKVEVHKNNVAHIDWGSDDDAFITIYPPDKDRIEFYITNVIATDKKIVLQILSTLKFTE